MIKRAVPLFALILVFSFLFYTTYGSYKGEFKIVRDQSLRINTTENNVTRLPMNATDLEERRYIVINESLHAAVRADDCYVDYSNVKNTTGIFLVLHHEGVTNVSINLARADFSIDEVLKSNGDVEEALGFAEFFQGENSSSLVIKATNLDPHRPYLLYLSWHANFPINESTTMSANLTRVNGNFSSVTLDLVDEKGSSHGFELKSNITSVWQSVINSTSRDIFGKNFSDFFGRGASAMNLVMTLDPGKSATVELDALSYCTDGGKPKPLPITLQDSVDCNATVYVGESFNLKNLPVGLVTWCIPIIAALYAYRLVRRMKIENINDKRHNRVFRG